MKISFIIATVFSFFGIAVHAAPVTFTGAELFNNPAVSFPGDAPTLQGDSLRFEFPANDSILFSIGLDGLVENPAHLVFSGNLTRVGSDHDPRLYLTDGLNAVGIRFADIFDNGATDRGLISVSFAQISNGLVSAAGGLALIGDFQYTRDGIYSFNAVIHAQEFGTLVSASASGFNESRATTAVLNLDRPLSLIFVAAEVNAAQNEIYQINSLTLDSIAAPVPEPGTMGLFLVAVSGLFGFRRLLC